MPSIFIPTMMRKYTDDERSVEVAGNSVAEALQALEARYPRASSQLYDEKGELKSFIAIFVNDTDIRLLSGKETPLRESDEVHIIPAIAGG
ncbi:MAG TPA: MoaD/ThiS family protein [Thermoanaerobaculia bacterium]|jgi:molybdopterin converting factor small subunit|nr:MoaD/ThiS family protein [Thermoanaerobaculia bacterium]